MIRTKYKLEEAKEIELENVLNRKNNLSYIHTFNKQEEKKKSDKLENNLIQNNEYSLKNLIKGQCLDEKINMRSPTNKLITKRFETQSNHIPNCSQATNQLGHDKHISYRKNLTINPVFNSCVVTSKSIASKTPVARGRSNSLSNTTKNNTSIGKNSKGSTPEKYTIKNLDVSSNQHTKQIDSNLSDIRKHLSSYYDSKKHMTNKNSKNDNYNSYVTSQEGKIEQHNEIIQSTTKFNEKNILNDYKQREMKFQELSVNNPEIEKKMIEEENLRNFDKSKINPIELSLKKEQFNTFGTLNNTIDSSRLSNQNKYSKTYNFRPEIFKKNNNNNSTNFKDSTFSTKIEEIRNANTKRLENLNLVNSYINCLSSGFNSHTHSRFPSNNTSKPNDKPVDEFASDDKIYLDSQIEQEKVRFEINKKIKNQVYDNEYSRVNVDIDYVNERLKLNEMSKSYLLNKINEFTTVKSVEDEKKPISPKEYAHYKCKNIEDYENQKNIGIR